MENGKRKTCYHKEKYRKISVFPFDFFVSHFIKNFRKIVVCNVYDGGRFDIDLIIVFRGICLLVISSLINLVEFHLISNVWNCARCSTTITWSNRRAIDKKTMKSNDQNWKLKINKTIGKERLLSGYIWHTYTQKPDTTKMWTAIIYGISH